MAMKTKGESGICKIPVVGSLPTVASERKEFIVKKCYVDLETTGLNPWVDGDGKNDKGVILSAGFILETGNEAQVIITPTEEEWGYANPIALEVNGMEWEYLVKFGVPFADAVTFICDWLADNEVTSDEWVFMAQNAPFDRKFLEHFMGDWLKFANAPETWVDFIPIYKDIGFKLGLNVRKQNTHHISQQLGVPEEPKPHEAIEGARALKRNRDELKSRAEKEGIAWPERG